MSPNTSQTNSVSNEQTSSSPIKTVSSSAANTNNYQDVLLPAIQINVRDSKGQVKSLRCLLDSGSQSSFVTERVCKMLNLQLNISKTGSNALISNITHQTNLTTESNTNNFSININCFRIPQITSELPSISFDSNRLKIPSNIKLADAIYNKTSAIDAAWSKLLIQVALYRPNETRQ